MCDDGLLSLNNRLPDNHTLKPQSDAAITRPVGHAPVWLRLLMPSITDSVFVLLLLAMSCGVLAPRLLGDGDIGWHIRNGELILQTHAVTHADPFSSTMQGKPWYSWEWLYDAGIAAVHQWAGLNAVVFVSALIIAFTFALLFRLALARGGNVLVAALFLLLSFGASAIHLFARPHIISWLLLIVWFEILDRAEQSASGTDKRIFWLPLTMLIWVNVHGEFVLAFVLLGIYITSGVVTFFSHPGQRESTRKRLWNLGTVAVASALATFANPYGYRLHLHIYQYLSDRWLINHIDEFQSPNFHGWAQQSFVLLLLLVIFVLAFARHKKLRLSQLLVALFAVHGAFYAARNLPTSCMLLTLIAAPLTSGGTREKEVVSLFREKLLRRFESFAERMGSLEMRLNWHAWPVVVTVCLLIACGNGGRFGHAQLMHAHFDSNRFPVAAADFISSQKIACPVFAPDAWGGYLIYRLGPATKVFVDDRHDLYGTAFLKNYVKVIDVSPGWRQVLDQAQLHWVLIQQGSSLAGILAQTSGWKNVYSDHTAQLFQRE